ncbi:MAG: class I SAM-dependent methyltransferase [Actinomycetota bacterium]
MKTESQIDLIKCPFCGSQESFTWAEENGFTAVKCQACSLVYVNPRPSLSLISDAVKTGNHIEIKNGRTVVGRRAAAKVRLYKKILSSMFLDVWANENTPISWLDIGAGFGEVVEAVSSLAPTGSKVEGLEPMKPKADRARVRGLNINEAYLQQVKEKFNYVSLVNVFSHLPDVRSFLMDITKVLTENGELYLETGNIGSLERSHEVPTELNLPDHLVFAGEKHILGYLEEAGFSVVKLRRIKRWLDKFLQKYYQETYWKKCPISDSLYI